MDTRARNTSRHSAALDLLAALSVVRDHDEYLRVLLDRVCGLFTADRGSVAMLTRPGVGAGLSWPAQTPAELADLFLHRYEEHPTIRAIRHDPLAPYRLRAEWRLQALRRLPIYHDFMRPLGDGDQLTIPLTVSDAGLVVVGLTRIGGDFTDRDLALLARLAGPVRHFYRSTRRGVGPRGLTPQQELLLRLVSEGHTDRMISNILGVSQRTVEKHLETVRSKLGVTSRAAAVASWLLGGQAG